MKRMRTLGLLLSLVAALLNPLTTAADPEVRIEQDLAYLGVDPASGSSTSI